MLAILKRVCVFLFLAAPALAQFTTVTGTVVDPNGLPYSFGTITTVLVFSGGTPMLNGGPYIQPSQATGLDKSGHFTVQLADTTALTPSGSKWMFTLCSAAGSVFPAFGKGSVCASTAAVTISGSSQDISATLNAIALPLTAAFGSGSTGVAPIASTSTQAGATSDVRISNAITSLTGGSGIVWANDSTNQSWAACPTWGSGNIDLYLYPVTYSIAVNCTIPTNVTVRPMQGAMLSPATGTVTTLKANLIAGQTQIFANALSGQGTVDFTGNLAVQTVYPEWWGASPAASAATNTPAIQASIWGAYGCGPDVCRVNGNAGLVYNKILQFSGLYSLNGTLTIYHMNGFHWLCLERLTCGLKQTATNAMILNGQSDSYGTFEKVSFVAGASENLNNPLVRLDYNASQGSDLATQFIDFKEVNIGGASTAAIGIQVAFSGGGAQGSNVYFHNVGGSGFTEAAVMIGAGSGCVPTALATNAGAIAFYGGDFQNNPAFAIEFFGTGIPDQFFGTTFEDSPVFFGQQTGYDICAANILAGSDVELYGVRSESPFLTTGGPFFWMNTYSVDQAAIPTPGGTPTVGQIVQGFMGSHGAYYQVTAVSGAFSGLGSTGSPLSASGGSATTIVDSVGGFTVNAWNGSLWQVSITGGTGANNWCVITSNTANTFTCSGGWQTDFPQQVAIVAAPDATSRYIVEPVYSANSTDGGVTLAAISKAESISSSAGFNFVPGLQVQCLAGGHCDLHGLQTTRSDWWRATVGFPFDNLLSPSSWEVLSPDDSHGTGAGNGNLSLLRNQIFTRNGVTEIGYPIREEAAAKVYHWFQGQQGGGVSTSDTYFGVQPNAGNKNGSQFLTNNSSGTARTWLWNADGSYQLGSATFATLPASANGTVIFCSDCNATCTAGASTGRTCFRENGAWTH